MKIDLLAKYPVGLLAGFVLGFFVVNPVSIVFEGMFIPQIKISLSSFKYAFHPQHLPMAFFFGALGMILGALNVFYLKTITATRSHIKLLEGLLPICSYCKKIRDDAGGEQGEGEWEKIENYIHKKTDQEFTHGICPDCAEKVFGPSGKNR